MSGTKLPPEVVDEIVEMINAGFDVNQVGIEVNVHPTTVRRICFLKGITPAKRRRIDSVTPEVKADVIARYIADEKIIHIITRHNLTYAAFYMVIAEDPTAQGLRKTYHAEAEKAREDNAIELYEQGAPLWKIKSDTGYSQPQIHEIMHKRGVVLRNSRVEKRKQDERNAPSLWDPNHPRPDRAPVADNEADASLSDG